MDFGLTILVSLINSVLMKYDSGTIPGRNTGGAFVLTPPVYSYTEMNLLCF
jgi:hypothetical protein